MSFLTKYFYLLPLALAALNVPTLVRAISYGDVQGALVSIVFIAINGVFAYMSYRNR